MGDLGSIPGLGGSPGEGNGYSLQYSGLENSMDKGDRQATVHSIAESETTKRLSLSLSYCMWKSVMTVKVFYEPINKNRNSLENLGQRFFSCKDVMFLPEDVLFLYILSTLFHFNHHCHCYHSLTYVSGNP